MEVRAGFEPANKAFAEPPLEPLGYRTNELILSFSADGRQLRVLTLPMQAVKLNIERLPIGDGSAGFGHGKTQ